MPIGAWAHSHFWRYGTPSPGGGGGWSDGASYPGWQTTVLLGMGFGGLQGLWERVAFIGRWLWRLSRLRASQRRWADQHLEPFLALPCEHRTLILHTISQVQSPVYPLALSSVKATAVTLGFNKSTAWKQVFRQIEGHQEWSENTWRHLEALRRLEWELQTFNYRLTNPQKHGIIELAYQGFALCPRPTTCKD